MAEGGGTGGLETHDEELKALITDVQRMQHTLKSKISNLNAVVDAIEVAWQGEGQKSFNTVQNKANTYAQTLDRKLQMMEEALQMSKDGFTANELKQVEDFTKLGNTSPIADFSGVGTVPTAR
ncbi:WXG100 family type VII secretion target [Streptomyces sp. N2-109]|uniref:WXG100 family type VII secretion target n=1 Tax=Streptomyces gossypii TaxID=2883101 RepID=A0ABT2K3D5_9ACTN|nr:WXG100 family type VII secretion target [Streptomyces gossypii]MCT2594695.1 WXG100 family type VII secretion target [Streptomyces gossypii]